VAAEMARALETDLRREYPGQRVSVTALTKAERNRPVLAAFDSHNGEAVCRHLGISLRTLRRVVGDA
jgi:hypothetical protein